MKYDLTVVLPSIRKERLPEFWNSLIWAVGPKYKCQLIIVSPYNLPEQLLGIPNISILQDFGSPARCVQMGSLLAEGEFITWNSDDAILRADSLSLCIDLLKTKTKKDGIIVRYSEGINRSGQEPPSDYWRGKHHGDQQFDSIDENWNIAPVGLYYTERWYELGGVDCRFEHINLNSHDFAYRNQRDGGKYYQSPTIVMDCGQMPGFTGDHQSIEEAYLYNDRDLFRELYNNGGNPIKINLDNWKDSPSVWRRFK